MCRKLICPISFVLVLAIGNIVRAGIENWQNAINTSNPLNWYRFDEITGTNCIDYGSGELDGTYDGVILGQEGFFGPATAVLFDATAGSMADFRAGSPSNLTWNWTVEYILKITTDKQTMALHCSTATKIALKQYSNDRVGYTALGNYDALFVPDTIVPIGEWTHLAITRNASANKMYLYINGVRVAEDDGRTIDLGRETIPRVGDWLDAFLDEAVVFNRVLQDDEILIHYKAIVSRDPEACNPIPVDGVTDVLRDVVLDWTPGEYADKHDVYFGTIFDDVNEAKRTDLRGVLASQNQDANTYDPEGLLDFGQTYYWRVDEVNAQPDNTIYKGYTWSFTAEPFVYPVENITATASSFQTDSEPENTINGSGLDDNDLHSTNPATMWLSSSTGPQPPWIRYEFDKAYKLHQMWVWNYNAEFESLLGFGLKDVIVEYSENGTDWQVLGDFEFAQAPGEEGYAHNTIVDFDGAAAKYVKLTANSHWGGLLQYGLSEVRFLYKPVHARQPKPASGQQGVPLDTVLSWRAGREAASHEVYLSEDMETMINGTALLGTVNQSSYDISLLGLKLGKTYYWKVNEVNEIENPASWEGEVWSFTTTEFLVVEDFEKYDNFCNRIFYAWVDGFGHSGDPECNVAPYGGNGTGSTVGNFNAPFAERIIVHEGRQSMPFGYNNASAPNYSETQRQTSASSVESWDTVQDWTKGGAGSLTVWFYGDEGNIPEGLYVAVEDSAGNIKVVSHSQPAALQAANWQQWNIPLTDFAGVDLSSVKKIYIGVGNRAAPTSGGTGKLYIDDIRLYPVTP